VLMSAMTSFLGEVWLENDDVSTFMSRLATSSNQINEFNSDEGQITDKFLMAKVLSSLPEKFGNFVQSWQLVADKHFCLSDFCEWLLGAERLMSKTTSTSTSEASGSALYVNNKNKIWNNNKKDK
jgi:hypothetical protein